MSIMSSRFKRKVIHDIYIGKLKTFNSFIEKYIATNKSLPEGHEADYFEHSDNYRTKMYLIESQDHAKKQIEEFSQWIKFLHLNNFLKLESYKPEYRIRLVFKSDYNDNYSNFDTHFLYHGLCDKIIVPNKKKLKSYIRLGCRTSEELKGSIKNVARFSISYILVPTIVALTFIFQFIWKPSCLTKGQNQTKIMGSKLDTLSKNDSLILEVPTDSLKKSQSETSQKQINFKIVE